jgi:hypothetical protein
MSHLRGGDEHPCGFLLFHMLSDIHLFLGVFCCSIHLFGYKVSHAYNQFKHTSVQH